MFLYIDIGRELPFGLGLEGGKISLRGEYTHCARTDFNFQSPFWWLFFCLF